MRKAGKGSLVVWQDERDSPVRRILGAARALHVHLESGQVQSFHRLDEGAPEIFNTGQGSQFTGYDFTGRLDKAEVRISMDGRGRCFDNGRSAASP